MNKTKTGIRRNNGSDSKGKLFVVGIGPGGRLDRTRRAEQAIEKCSVIVGYKRYLDNVSDITEGKELISSGMTKETDRCRNALTRAASGETVGLISSGDAGVYGMAGLAFELAKKDSLSVPIEVVPGVTAASAAAARLGAPLMLDFASISLSDLLVPWEMIKKRVEAVASADMTCALYNPRSKKRVSQLDEAAEIFRRYRKPGTPVGVCTSVGYDGEEKIVLTDLDNFLKEDIGMMTVVIIGSSDSVKIDERFVTPRGYRGKRF